MLYVKDRLLPEDRNSISMVGARRTTHYGQETARKLAYQLAGTGINIVYPAENAELYEHISENGAVLTQFSFNRQGDKQSFPIRNRIVAGMTLSTVVMEADLKSGSLITANMAADNNRQVFAVPGRVDSPQSRGCHNLIR